MEYDFDFNELLGGFRKKKGNKETEHLYKTHPHFDKYPDYMQRALIENEKLQGRMRKD